MTLWEFVGGPRCGDRVELPEGMTRLRVTRRFDEPRHPMSVGFNVPKPDASFTHGEYTAESEADRKRRVLRWQGWQ